MRSPPVEQGGIEQPSHHHGEREAQTGAEDQATLASDQRAPVRADERKEPLEGGRGREPASGTSGAVIR